MKELKEDLLSNITSLINEQNTQIENLNEKPTQQNSTISILQNNVEVLHEHCLKLQKDINTKCDGLEQYSRRQCLRIEGIVKLGKEKAEMLKISLKSALLKPMLTFQILYYTGHIELVLSTKMSQIRTFKELLLNLITLDIDQCSTKIGRN